MRFGAGPEFPIARGWLVRRADEAAGDRSHSPRAAALASTAAVSRSRAVVSTAWSGGAIGKP